MDDKTTIAELKRSVQQFCEERDWDQFHNAKELAIGIITEAGELLQPLRFKSEEQIRAMLSDEKTRKELSEELADTLYFVLRFAQMYDIDLSTEVHNKLEKNNKRYSVELTKGSNKKYDEYM